MRQKSAELITRPVRRTHATRSSLLLLLLLHLLLLLPLLLPLAFSLFCTETVFLPRKEWGRGREEREERKIERRPKKSRAWTDGRVRLRDFVGTRVKANWSINYPDRPCVCTCVYESRFALALSRETNKDCVLKSSKGCRRCRGSFLHSRLGGVFWQGDPRTTMMTTTTTMSGIIAVVDKYVDR